MLVEKQLSVFLENKPGQLSQICGILAENDVNITAITVHDAVDHGIVRLVVDNPTKALLLLEQAEFYVMSHDVVVMEIENKPGIIATVAKKLFRADINIEYAYCTAVKNQNTGCLVIKTKDAEQTFDVLEARFNGLPKKAHLRPLFLGVFVFCCVANEAVALEARQKAHVDEVLSGDSVRLSGGRTLRYIGFRSAPLQHLVPLVRQYGREALDYNRGLVGGKDITIEWGPQLREDNSQALLGYVYLADGTFVNDKILQTGYGKIFIKAPNTRYAEQLRKSELSARRQRLGMWRQEPDNPFIKEDYYGDTNTKFFYYANHPDLQKIPDPYLVTFRSRVEAVAAGYKPCATCKGSQTDIENSF